MEFKMQKVSVTAGKVKEKKSTEKTKIYILEQRLRSW